MLIDNLRQKTQSKGMKLIMGVVALSFAMFGVQNYLIGGSKAALVAKVGSKTITESALNQETERALNQWAAQKHQKPSHVIVRQMRQRVLANQIRRVAQITNAENVGFYVDNALVSQAILDDPTFASSGSFDHDQYLNLLRRAGMSEGHLFETISNAMLIKQLQASIIATSFVLPNEVQRFATLGTESRDVALVNVPSKIGANLKVSEKETQSYYDQHHALFMTQERVKLAYLLLDRKALMAEMKPSHQAIHDFYSNHFDQSKPLSKVRSEVIKQFKQQKSEQQFLTLSDQLTDLSYGEGGSLDSTAKQLGLPLKQSAWITKGGSQSGMFSNHTLIDAAFSDGVLKEGENSGLIAVDDARAMVLRIASREPAVLKPLSQVRKTINTHLLKRAREEAKLAEANKMKQAILGLKDMASLKAYVKKHHLKMTLVRNITRIPSKRYSEALQSICFQQLTVQPSHLSAALLLTQNVQIAVLLARHTSKVTEKALKDLNVDLGRAWAQAELSSLQHAILTSADIQLQ